MTDTDNNSVATSSAVNNASSSIDLNYGYFIGESLGPFDNAAVVDNVKPLTSTGVSEEESNLARTQPLLSEEGGGAPANSKTEQESDSTNSSESNSNSGSSSSSSSSSSSGSNEHMEHVVKLRGLPWSCTKDDIIDFLGSECRIYGDANGIHMITTPEGKASGEALVELASEEDLAAALKKDKRDMGHRYIEVFKITRNEMEWVLKRSRPVSSSNNGSFASGGGRANGSNSETFVRLRGLPYECTTEDIHNFFHGLEIVSNHLMVDGMGRSSGEAYVQFATKDQAQKALGKDREMIKHRYVEIFVVSPTEARNMQSMVSRVGRSSALNTRAGPYDRPNNRSSDSSRYGGSGRQSQSKYFNKGFENETWNNYDCWSGGGNNARSSNINPPPLIPGLKRNRELDGNTRHCVLMRGLPYRADESDIRRFFCPLNPTAVHIIYESSGRPSGTAKVNFASNDDVTRAMAKHKDRMDHRYIELFVHRT